MLENKDPWYWSTKWLRMRERVLRRDKYIDQERARYGVIVEAKVVHHIFPKDQFPQYALEPWNLISLSRETHNAMHIRDTQELTEKGKELLRRTCRRHHIEVPEMYKRKTFKRGVHADGYYTG